MTKILINNTAAALNLEIGLTVPANGQLTLQPFDFIEAADSDELVELIGNGTITVSDGSSNLGKAQGISLIQSNFSKTDFDDNLIEADRLKVDVVGTLGDGKVRVTPNDNNSEFLNSKISVGSNKLSKSVINAGAAEELQIDIASSNINTSELNNDANFINSSQAPVQPSDIENFETSAQLNVRDTANRNRSNHTGTQTASTISDFAAQVKNDETTTNLTFNSSTNILTYTDEDGNNTDIDLSQFIDDTNLARITSGTIDPVTNIATFTRDDSSTFTLDFSSLNDQAAIATAISNHETTIENHNDVNFTRTPTLGDRLIYNGTSWNVFNEFKVFESLPNPIGTQLATFQNCISLNSATADAGNYKVTWYYEWSLNTTTSDFEARIRLNNTTDLANHRQEPKDAAGTGITVSRVEGGTFNSGTDQRHQNSGSVITNLGSGSFSIDLDFRNSTTGSTEATIYKAYIIVERFN